MKLILSEIRPLDFLCSSLGSVLTVPFPGSNTPVSQQAFPPLSPAPRLKCDGITLSPCLKQAETDIAFIIFSRCFLGIANGARGIEVQTQVNLPKAPLLSSLGRIGQRQKVRLGHSEG